MIEPLPDSASAVVSMMEFVISLKRRSVDDGDAHLPKRVCLPPVPPLTASAVSDRPLVGGGISQLPLQPVASAMRPEQLLLSVTQQIGLIAPGFLSRVILLLATNTPDQTFIVTVFGVNITVVVKNGKVYLHLDHHNVACVPSVLKELSERKIDVDSFTIAPGRIVGYVQPPADIDQLFRPALLASGFESIPSPAGIYHFGRKGDGAKLQVVLRTSNRGNGTTFLMYGSESVQKQKAVFEAMQALLPHPVYPPQVAVLPEPVYPPQVAGASPTTMAAIALGVMAGNEPSSPAARTRSKTNMQKLD
jgi:hypothetical protein